jgi:hypothetical protein
VYQQIISLRLGKITGPAFPGFMKVQKWDPYDPAIYGLLLQPTQLRPVTTIDQIQGYETLFLMFTLVV